MLMWKITALPIQVTSISEYLYGQVRPLRAIITCHSVTYRHSQAVLQMEI